jgi:hypothetical protein
MVGQEYSFGDIKVACGRISRRTNDTQALGTCLCLRYKACSLVQHAEAALSEFKAMVFEEMAAQFASAQVPPAIFLPVVPTGHDLPFGVCTAKHEAALYLLAVNSL